MAPDTLSPSLRETIAVFDGPGPLTTPEVADRLEIARRTTYARLERLADRDFIETKKAGANARVWWRPDARREERGPIGDEPFARLLEDLEVGMFVLDANFDVAWINNTTEQYFDIDRDEVIGQNKRTLIREHISSIIEDDEAFTETLFQTYADNTYIEQFECRVTAGAQRQSRWLEHRSRPITRGPFAGGRVELYYDLTDLRQSQRAEQERAEEFHSLIEAVEDYAIFTLDPEGHIESWNPGAAQIKGYDAEEIIGEHFSTFYTEEDRAAGIPAQNLGTAITSGPITDEGWRVRKDGSQFWASITISAIRDDDGEVTGFAKVTRDMTEQRDYQRRLERQAERLERQRDDLEDELDDIFTRIDDAFIALDKEWHITYVNDRAADLVGNPPGKLIGANVWDVFYGIEDAHPRHRAEQAMETQEPTEFEFYSDVLDAWYEIRCYPAAAGMSVYFRDVTERKEREEEIEQTRAQLEAATRAGEIGVWEWQIPEDRFFMGSRFAKLFDIDPAAAEHGVGIDRLFDAVHEDDRDRIEQAIDDAIARCGSFEEEYRVWDSDDELRWVVARGHVECDHAENAIAFPGALVDITERKRSEIALERRREQQRAVADLGQFALDTDDLDELMGVACTTVADTLDNEFCKVLDLDRQQEELLLRQGVGWRDGIVGSATVAADENSQAGYTLEVGSPVVVSDLNSEERFSGPELLTSHDITSGISTIIGRADAPWGILGTHDRGHKEFTREDVTFVQAVANVLATAIERRHREQTLERQRDQLAALNNLNQVVSEITDAVIEQSTRKEIEQTVCDAVADSDAYMFAWLAEVDPNSETFEPRAAAKTDGYVEEIQITMDADDPRSQGPGATAIREGETQIVRDVFEDPDFEPWRAAAKEHGFRAVASIPIVHEETVYGVLGVYSDREAAFNTAEVHVISQIGRVVGHAIAATERRRALMSDELVELEFHIDAFLPHPESGPPPTGTIHLDHVVPIEDGEFLVFGTATPEAIDELQRHRNELEHWSNITIRERTNDLTFELELHDPPILSPITAIGGYIDTAVVEAGDLSLTIHVSPAADIRHVIDLVEDRYPQADMTRRQQITRSQDGGQQTQLLADELTDRQREVLEVALYSGYFEWPRTASGEEVADSLGIAPATFSQHLRRAQRQVFEDIFPLTDRSLPDR